MNINFAKIVTLLIAKIVTLLIAIIVVIPSLARAEPTSPFYLELGTGLAINKGKEIDSGLSVASHHSRHQDTHFISGSIGYIYSPSIRFDINYTNIPTWKINSHYNTTNSQTISYHTNVHSHAMTVNGYYDFDNPSSPLRLKPYVTAGIGMSYNKIDNTDVFVDRKSSSLLYSNTQNNLTYRLGAGGTLKINDYSFLDFGYRYTNLGKINTNLAKGTITGKLLTDQKIGFKRFHSHQILIGVGIRF